MRSRASVRIKSRISRCSSVSGSNATGGDCTRAGWG
jgi:hypothetical protein